MRTFIEPERAIWDEITSRTLSDDSAVESRVREIVDAVRAGGDSTIKRLAREIDGIEISSISLLQDEIDLGAESVPGSLQESIRIAAENISAFHKAQMPAVVDIETAPGVRCVQKAVPITRVGLYIPGGTAPLFSTVLMLAIPAKIAGCKELIMCTPRGKDGKVAPAVLFAAKLCGVDRVFGIGGAQAIAAMAYGTESVPKVSKIFGPGNRYVAKAKRLVSENGVAIDMFAGPSEVLVLADSTSNPAFVAADLLSQAEHGTDSRVCVVCDSCALEEAIHKEVQVQMSVLDRREIAEKAMSESISIVLSNRGDMVDFANVYAAEHLIISTSDPWDIANQITAAGSVFIGNYSPESAGDYASGTNHTLPTSGTAVACSGVNLDSFMHKITYQELTPVGLSSIAKVIVEMAQAEGLDAHANAVKVRMKSK